MNQKPVSLILFSILLVGIVSAALSNDVYAVASITLSPTSGIAGSTVTVTGSGFNTGSSITILFDGASVQTATVSSSGSFTATFTVPTFKQPGTYNVVATDNAANTALAAFTVTSPAAITLSPSSSPAGTVVTVSGSKFANNTSITIKFDGATVTTNPSTVTSSSTGGFTASFTVPSTASGGSHTVTASDGTNTASATFTVVAIVTLSPTSGIVGTTVTVSGSAFGASKTITVKFDSNTVTTNPATITTSSSGTFSATFAIPSGATAGSHTLSATDGTITGSAIFNVSSTASVTLSPTSGATGSTVTVAGSGFTTNASVAIKFDSNTIATTPATIIASSSGTFSATITVPSAATSGNHTISASDVTGKTASAIFKVIIPATITLSPTAGQRSTTVTVSGSDFNPSSVVTVKFDGTTLATTPATVTTSASGSFSATVTIPNTASAGSHTISATDAAGKSASATFSVSLGPAVILSPTSGITGTEVTVTGSNFTKNTPATVKFGKILVATSPSSVMISPTGTLLAKFLVPAGVATGGHIVSVRDDTGRIGNATFTVQASVSTSISLSPTSAAPGATVTVTGANFASNASVTIKFDGSNITTVTTTATGTFSTTFAIPSTASSGSHIISATDGTKTASTTLNVTLQATSQASISLSSTTVTAGSSVTISGSGFAPSSTVTIKLDGNVVATSTASSTGSFSAAINIPVTVTQGTHSISVSDGTNSSTTTLSITAEIREKVALSNVKLVDQTGTSVSSLSEGMQILIQSDLKNNLASDQQFVYIVQVKDSDGATVMISWMSGTLPAGKQYAVAQSWLAEGKGNYSVDVFVWQSISNPVVLAPASKATITVS